MDLPAFPPLSPTSEPLVIDAVFERECESALAALRNAGMVVHQSTTTNNENWGRVFRADIEMPSDPGVVIRMLCWREDGGIKTLVTSDAAITPLEP